MKILQLLEDAVVQAADVIMEVIPYVFGFSVLGVFLIQLLRYFFS